MERPAPVLYVDNSFTFGGAINALADIVRELDRTRYAPVVLSAQDVEFLQQSFPDASTHHWPVRLPWVHDPIDRHVRRLPGFGRGPLRTVWDKARALWWLAFEEGPEAFRIARFGRARNIRLVHLNNGVESMGPALAAAKLMRVPVVAHARGPQATTGAARLYAQWADHWIAVSEHIAQNLVDAGVDRAHISVVHDAINLNVFTPAPPPSSLRGELGIPADAPIFGVFARIIPWKGIREFVLAARKVIDAVPGARALVVGDSSDGDEDYFREVVQLARELGIEDRVIFTGFRRDVADLMRLCDVVAHTSIIPEPFGLTVIEAMAVETAVVGANSGGPAEIVDAGVTGLLADPSSADDFSGAIIGLLRDPARRAEIARNGAAIAQQRYSATRYARDIEDVYLRVLGS